MERIETKVFSHLSFDSSRRTDNRQVAADRGTIVNNYRDLFYRVARISYENPKFNLLFRGQDIDPRVTRPTKFGPRSSIFPKIYRLPNGKKNLRSDIKRSRLDEMAKKCRELVKNYPFGGITRLKRFEEMQWAILQHYKVASTPLIDMTDSLQVASTFATRNNKSEYGYVFVFGIPYSHGSISHHVDDGIVVVRLASACPPDALRAHYQHAYFVGSYPHDHVRNSSKNAANLLIAKFRVPVRGFWGGTFRRVPESVLFPEGDKMEGHLVA